MQQSGRYKPAAVKRWETTMMEFHLGCVASGERYNLELHHVLGYTYKHDKIHIGCWYILPLAERYHNAQLGNPFNVTDWPKRFAIEFGFQRDLFMKRITAMESSGILLPFDLETRLAIVNSPLR
jgi:hypothetical protein